MEIELTLYLKKLDYDDEDIEYMVNELLPIAKKYIGWEDKRRDNRFIVKFHDIIYDKGFNNEDETMNQLFDDFCQETYEWVKDEMANKKCYEKDILTTYSIGHYQGLKLERAGVHSITEENIYDVVASVFNEFCGEYDISDKLRQHIETVNILQELEDTYKNWWGEYVRDYKECINGE